MCGYKWLFYQVSCKFMLILTILSIQAGQEGPHWLPGRDHPEEGPQVHRPVRPATDAHQLQAQRRRPGMAFSSLVIELQI